MLILAIDYGKRKIGLAIGDTTSKLAEPLRVVRFESEEEALKDIANQTEMVGVEKIVVGISEGKMAKETKEFGKRLERSLKVPVSFQDETLTTHEAQRLAIQAGITRKKRKGMEDAYSAALILQNYLDSVI